MIISFIKKLRNKIYHFQDNENYYGKFKGSLNFWKLILFNVLYPGRFLNQLKHGQFKYLNFIKNKFSKKPMSNEILNEKFFQLNNYGSITISNFFSKELINKFKEDYSEEIDKLKSQETNENKYFKNTSLKIKKSLIDLWLNKEIIELLEKYMGKKLYARNYPTLNYSVGKRDTNSRYIHKIETSNVSDVWHVDHSTLISCHIFLEDVEKNGTCMEFLKGTNKYLNSNFAISDEIVQKSKLEISQCYGQVGSINIHCGNVVHRMRPKPDSNRLMLTLGFSAGSNLMLDVNKIAKCLSAGFEIDNLDLKSRDILNGIFPKKMSKGYDLNKENLKPTSFKGI